MVIRTVEIKITYLQEVVRPSISLLSFNIFVIVKNAGEFREKWLLYGKAMHLNPENNSWLSFSNNSRVIDI